MRGLWRLYLLPASTVLVYLENNGSFYYFFDFRIFSLPMLSYVPCRVIVIMSKCLFRVGSENLAYRPTWPMLKSYESKTENSSYAR